MSRRTPAAFPPILSRRAVKVEDLRYGENPHQEAALYRDPASTGPSVVNSRQLHGKELSYNNILDAASALEAAKSLARLQPMPACVVVKHTNPCGGAIAPTVAQAAERAIAGDTVAAYGGILASSRPIDADAARVIADPTRFFEVIIAPSFSPEALEMLRSRWSSVRLLEVGDRMPSSARKLEYRSVPGGMLVQDRDTRLPDPATWQLQAGPTPSSARLAQAAALEVLCRFVSSNAIVVGGLDPLDSSARGSGAVRLFGIGSGQVDRVSACRLAVAKAGELCRAGEGAICLSDAFFPFPDGPEVLANAGVTMIVHPGGSKRDQETIDLCRARGITCMTTGMRHFRH
jgi:phosphoribosylaminoimidazolecarboxamide formyltransferase/IMP cyclohydrolase